MSLQPVRRPHEGRRVAIILATSLAIVASIVLAASAGASAHGASSRIVNGTKVAPGTYASRWGFITALVAHDAQNVPGSQFCAGSLIAPDRVLTAAHCVRDPFLGGIVKPGTIDVVAGTSRLSGGGAQRRAVTAIVVHPQNDSTLLTYDFAILQLASPVTGITPVPLVGPGDAALWGAGLGQPVTPGSGPFIGGWGLMSDGGSLPDDLREAQVPIVSDAACINGGGSDGVGLGVFFDPTSQLCAGVLNTAGANQPNNAVDSCNGDSGGPLIVSDGAGGYKLAGVVSWGLTGCASRVSYGVYGRVGAVSGWANGNPPPRPVNTSKPVLTGNPVVGGTLSCSTGTWTGAGPITYTYIWLQAQSGGGGGFSFVSLGVIDGANNSTYKPTKDDVDSSIYCVVKAANESGPTNSTSNGLGPVTGDDGSGPGDGPSVVVRKVSTVCVPHSCTITVDVTSPDGSTITAVDGIAVGRNVCHVSHHRRHCTRITKLLRASHRSGSQWQARIGLPPGHYATTIVGMDRFGSRSSGLRLDLGVA